MKTLKALIFIVFLAELNSKFGKVEGALCKISFITFIAKNMLLNLFFFLKMKSSKIFPQILQLFHSQYPETAGWRVALHLQRAKSIYGTQLTVLV